MGFFEGVERLLIRLEFGKRVRVVGVDIVVMFRSLLGRGLRIR